MLKSDARNKYRTLRSQLPPARRMKWDDLILIQFQQLPLPDLHSVFAYAATPEEVPTDAIVDYLLFRFPGLKLAYPVADFSSGRMQAVLADDATVFDRNAYGIYEPQGPRSVLEVTDIDLVLVPLLCFDLQGYRVGYGKGFYDRFLAGTGAETLKIGLSYFEPLERLTDRNKFDVPLDYCITPERIYEF
ncbi:5-formyltetrahydrofolate cyclo-ligase [Niabella terrae]